MALTAPNAFCAAVDQYWRTDGTAGTWGTSTYWSASATTAGGTGWTSGNNAIFSANSTLTFSTTAVGNVTVADNSTVNVSSAGTLTLGGVRTFTVGNSSILTWSSQSQSSAAANEGSGIIKNGNGTLSIGAGAGTSNARYDGGFTLNAGTIIVSGNNSFTSGGLAINGGTIQSTNSSGLFDVSSVTIGGNFSFAGTVTDSYSGNASLGSSTRTISDSGSGSHTLSNLSSSNSAGLNYVGSSGSSLTLSGTNSYGGSTSVTGGNLVINGSTVASNSFTIGDGSNAASGTLVGMSSNIAGSVSIQTGGTITAGSGTKTSGTTQAANDTIGKLTTGAQTWVGNASSILAGTYLAKVASSTTSDELIMSGLTLSASSNAKFNISVASNAGTANIVYSPGTGLVLVDDMDTTSANIFNKANSTATLAALNLTVAGITDTGHTLALYTAGDGSGGYELVLDDSQPMDAPEPTSAILLGLAAMPMLVERRRRKTSKVATV